MALPTSAVEMYFSSLTTPVSGSTSTSAPPQLVSQKVVGDPRTAFLLWTSW